MCVCVYHCVLDNDTGGRCDIFNVGVGMTVFVGCGSCFGSECKGSGG